jgi:hypothetical protein
MPRRVAPRKNPRPHFRAKLIQLLDAAIDGYESETGDLRYWNPAKINRARDLLDSLPPVK